MLRLHSQLFTRRSSPQLLRRSTRPFPIRCFSFGRASRITPALPAFRSTFKIPFRQFQTTAPEGNFSEFTGALTLLGNAGIDLTHQELVEKLGRVLTAAGISFEEEALNSFVVQEHRIPSCDQQDLVEIARQLFIKGGDEHPNAAGIVRVLASAGIEMDQAQVEELMMPAEETEVEKPKSRWGIAAFATGAAVLFGKSKYILVALKLTKMGPLVSMMLSSVAYSFVFGWPYAVGMVAQIFLHESGHAAVMRHYGIPFSPMVFVPFAGAYISAKDAPRSAEEEAMIAFGGPAAGTLGAVALAVAGAATGSPFLVALADFGFMVNLFNLMPISVMDGGRIAGTLSPWINVLGLGGGVMLAFVGAIKNPLFYLVLITGSISTVMRFLEPPQVTYNLNPAQRFKVAAGYIGLIGFLLWAMYENNKRKLTPKQAQAQKEGRLHHVPHNDPEMFYTDETWETDKWEADKPRWV